MGMSDYQQGYQAYFSGFEYDSSRSFEWCRGWIDAEDDDYDSYDDSYDYGYGDDDYEY